MKDFDDIVTADEEIEKRRSKLERSIVIFAIIFGGIGIGVAIAAPSVLQTIVYWFTPAGLAEPVFVNFTATSGNNFAAESTNTNPTFNNSYARFNVSFSDTDSYEWHTMVVCNGTAGNYTFTTVPGGYSFTCGGNLELCRYSDVFVTDNPLSCDYYVAGLGNQTQNYTSYVIDSGERVANVSGTFVVNRPPYIDSVEMVVQ